MRVVSLGSGSSGNAFLVEAGPQGRTRLLIDAGLSARTIVSRLATVGVSPAQLKGILVTHEHSDHVQGIPMLVKRFGLPVIADPRTLAAIETGMMTGTWTSDSGKPVMASRARQDLLPSIDISTTTDVVVTSKTIDASNAHQLVSKSVTVATTVTPMSTALFQKQELLLGSKQLIGDIEVTSFPISHDAVAPGGYLLHAGGCRMCLVTDSGEVTPTMLEAMQYADLLILESNHDYQRLIRGPYPWYLKKRIMSPRGHLSNDQAAEAVLRIWREGGMRWLWLAHLSRTNNTPTIATETMRSHLLAAHANLAHIRIAALPPSMGNTWDSRQLLS